MDEYLPPEGDKLGFDLTGEGYSAPEGDKLAFDFRYRPPYIPPAGNQVPLAFGPAYTPPTGGQVALEFVPSEDGPPAGDTQYLFPVALYATGYGYPLLIPDQFVAPDGVASEVIFGQPVAQLLTRFLQADGIDSGRYGSSEVWNWYKQAWPIGFQSGAYGKPSIHNTVQIAHASGFATTRYGTQHIWNSTFQAFPGGIAPPPQTGPNGNRQLPSPWVSFWTRYLTPGGIAVPTNQIPTTHVVTPDIQFIDLAGRGPNPWVTGNARIEYTVRYIEPPFIASNIFGSHNVARIQVVTPSGWESSFLSENHELDINLQRVFHHSGEADPAEYGATYIRNQREVLRPTGWLSQDINFPTIYNLDQYLFVQPYMGTNSDPTQWPNYSPLVENKRRYLGPGGFISSRFSVIGNWIWNKAAPIVPEGLYGTEWGPDTSITHRIRYVGPEGWDSFYTTQYTVIYRTAVVLAPQGWDSAVVGAPEQVLGLNRTVKHVFPYGGETVGTAFIADAVRTIRPSLFYDVPSGFPEVRYNPYPIAPAGIVPPQFGGHTVFERFTVFYPASVNVHSTPWVGQPDVQNRNKTLRVFPSEQSLYGIAVVSNYNTHLTVTAGDLTVWGSHLISYRTRTATVAPISVPVFSVTHLIRNVLPDPPSRQLIAPPGTFTGNTEGNPGIIPAPRIRLATFYPTGFTDPRVGQHNVRSNTIISRPWPFNPDQLGTPLLSATQYVSPNTVPWPNTNPPESSSDRNWVWAQRPRVSPHTIYAPSSDQATGQARDNHPSTSPRVIDYNLSISNGRWSRDGGWPFFGRPDISNWFRTIGPVPNHSGWVNRGAFGVPGVVLRRRFVRPNPIISLRTGIVTLWGVPQYVNFNMFNDGVPPYNVFGKTTVAPPPLPPFASPSGFVATLWGSHRVELFNRTVSTQGIPHRGNPQQGLTNPWGRPLVGYPREYRMGGWNFTLWGDAWVSHKNRELPVEGWDSLSLEDDDLGSFADRMHVRRRNPEGGLDGIGPDSVVGNHTVTPFMRAILGRGILSYNSGDHIVKAVAKIEPAGWDSFETGDIDRWEAGKIKAHGDDLSSVGTPRTRFRVTPTGPSEGVVEQPRVGSLVYPLGIPEIGFAGPSVSNPFGCTNRVVAPLPILPQQNVPEPVVSAA